MDEVWPCNKQRRDQKKVEDELEQQVKHAGEARDLRLFQNTPSGNGVSAFQLYYKLANILLLLSNIYFSCC